MPSQICAYVAMRPQRSSPESPHPCVAPGPDRGHLCGAGRHGEYLEEISVLSMPQDMAQLLAVSYPYGITLVPECECWNAPVDQPGAQSDVTTKIQITWYPKDKDACRNRPLPSKPSLGRIETNLRRHCRLPNVQSKVSCEWKTRVCSTLLTLTALVLYPATIRSAGRARK